uniref:Short-chain dehydrogenase n=1 Tax=Syphacia muris TaxID=451379 RepID=A0A0N5A8Q7_9BILA
MVLLLLLLSKKYFKGAQFAEDVDATGKIALVTGANSGIGFQIARLLNEKGATVYMLCKDYERAFTARIELTQLGCNPDRLIIKVVDLAQFASIHQLVNELKQEIPVIDILINNAGIMSYPRYELTMDGYEMTWQTNYLGHFLLTELLLPLMELSSDARIINVSSSLHKFADSVDFFFVNDPRNFGRRKSYYRSKLAQVMHARELSRRLRTREPSTNITINAMHPGMCATNLCRYSFFMKTLLRYLFKLPMWFFMKTAKDGAQTAIFLALSENVKGISGRYFGECKEKDPSSKALDDDQCNILYNYSIEATEQQLANKPHNVA